MVTNQKTTEMTGGESCIFVYAENCAAPHVMSVTDPCRTVLFFELLYHMSCLATFDVVISMNVRQLSIPNKC